MANSVLSDGKVIVDTTDDGSSSSSAREQQQRRALSVEQVAALLAEQGGPEMPRARELIQLDDGTMLSTCVCG